MHLAFEHRASHPELVVRVAAHHASINGCIGAMMKSEWKDTRRPLRTSDPARTIWSARSWPRPSFALLVLPHPAIGAAGSAVRDAATGVTGCSMQLLGRVAAFFPLARARSVTASQPCIAIGQKPCGTASQIYIVIHRFDSSLSDHVLAAPAVKRLSGSASPQVAGQLGAGSASNLQAGVADTTVGLLAFLTFRPPFFFA